MFLPLYNCLLQYLLETTVAKTRPFSQEANFSQGESLTRAKHTVKTSEYFSKLAKTVWTGQISCFVLQNSRDQQQCCLFFLGQDTVRQKTVQKPGQKLNLTELKLP